jgi:predicted ATPase/class 3 adenylate cyclase
MTDRRPDLPTGTVTFLFSDIEGSTRLAHDLEPDVYRQLLEEHNRILRDAFETHGGVERGTQGDAFLVIFRDAPSAIAAAVDAQQGLAGASWPAATQVSVRMGLHTGEGIRGGDDYVGLDVNRAARIADAAHGGQVVISDATRVLAERSLPDGVQMRPAGEHRLPGLDAPERLFELTIAGLQSEFPPLRTRERPDAHLPPRMTSFVGRRDQLHRLRSLLTENRLVTLVGPAGTGKTSLAVELARDTAENFRDGAWFVGLDAVTDPSLVGSTIAAAIGLRDPTATGLAGGLVGRSMLLVLDNFEQVLDAAPLVGELLAVSHELRAVVTSRAPLRVAGEQVYQVPPLEVPAMVDEVEVASLERVPSVRLFVDRARRLQPSFELRADNARAVAEICALLDGLPLGIELAATRVPLLGAAGVRNRLIQGFGLPGAGLRDTPSRHRTLEEAIAWSHDLLEPETQLLLAQLAVFSGGWRMEQAELICGGPGAGDVATGLSELVDHSLVTTHEHEHGVRFGMLETIHAFARDRLAERADETAVRRRHAIAYLALLDDQAPKIRLRRVLVHGRLGEDWDNVRAAIRWSVDACETELALRLVGGAWRLWSARVEMELGLATTMAALALPGAEQPTVWRMRALEAAGGLFYYSGQDRKARETYQAQLALARELDDRRGVADAMFNLAFTEDFSGRLSEGLAMVDQIAAAYRDVGDELGEAQTAWLRADVFGANEHNADAVAILETAIDRFRDLGLIDNVAIAASGLALRALQGGDSEAALRWLLRYIEAREGVGDSQATTLELPVSAVLALAIGRPVEGAMMLGAYEALSRRYGISMPQPLRKIIERHDPRSTAIATLGDAAFQDAARRGAEMTSEEAADFVARTFGAAEASAATPTPQLGWKSASGSFDLGHGSTAR